MFIYIKIVIFNILKATNPGSIAQGKGFVKK